MAFESNLVSFIGNLTADPELKYVGQKNTPVANFTVASNRKFTQNGEEKDEATFMRVNVWGDYAVRAAESLEKGLRVVIIGRLRVRSYENKDGATVWTTEIEADEVAASLRFATAKVTRATTGNGGAPRDVPPPSTQYGDDGPAASDEGSEW